MCEMRGSKEEHEAEKAGEAQTRQHSVEAPRSEIAGIVANVHVVIPLMSIDVVGASERRPMTLRGWRRTGTPYGDSRMQLSAKPRRRRLEGGPRGDRPAPATQYWRHRLSEIRTRSKTCSASCARPPRARGANENS